MQTVEIDTKRKVKKIVHFPFKVYASSFKHFFILWKLEFSIEESAKEKRKPHIQFSSGCICPYVSLSSACVNYSKAVKVLLRIYAAE